MPGTKKQTEMLPESFASIEEAAEWWDTHSTADDWNETKEVYFEINIKKPRHVALDRNLAKELSTVAAQQGVSLETLVNLWLQEKLKDTAPTP